MRHGSGAYDKRVNRVLGLLLVVATALVAAAAVYVIVRDDPVPQAGQTPGYSDSAVPPSSTATSSTPAASGSTSVGAAPPVRVAFLGDDYALGKGASSSAKGFAALLSRELNLDETIVGSVGAGYAKATPGGSNYSDLVGKVVAARPDVVVVSGGRNDLHDDVGTLQSATKSLFTKLRDRLPDAALLAIRPFYGDSPHPDGLRAVDSAIKDGVTAAGGKYLDIKDPLAGHQNWMRDDTDPNNKGHQGIADALVPKLKAVLPN